MNNTKTMYRVALKDKNSSRRYGELCVQEVVVNMYRKYMSDNKGIRYDLELPEVDCNGNTYYVELYEGDAPEWFLYETSTAAKLFVLREKLLAELGLTANKLFCELNVNQLTVIKLVATGEESKI